MTTVDNDIPIGVQHSLLLMIEDRNERRNGWTYIPVRQFPKLSELDSETYIGSWAWTQVRKKRRWLKENVITDYGAGWVTPADIARDYLRVKFNGKRLRCNKYQYKALVKNRKSQPLLAKPCTLDNAVYLDLQSAYWQLLMVGGWDIDYMPSGFLAVRSDVADFPFPQNKLARNSLVSMGLPSSVTVWIPDKGLTRRSTGKSNVNLVLWGFVQDVLHTFASDMINKAGAVYVNTDGYIISMDKLETAMRIADEWGLVLRMKERGRATIRGVGDYDIGGHISKRPRKVARPHKYIEPIERDWLCERVKHFSHRIDLNAKWTELYTLK
jgi:hypothetical protein